MRTLALPALALLLLGGPSLAAEAQPSDVRKGFATVGTSTSDEPALRAVGTPSQPYRLGAALAAWANAREALDFVLKNPSGDGDDTDAIEMACFDETKAFGHLEAARTATGLAGAPATQAAGAPTTIATDWEARRAAGPLPRCARPG